MKLKWPLWQIVTAWFILHLIGFLSLAYGWLTGLGFIVGIVLYILYGAFAQSVGYGIIVGKKALKAWKEQYNDPTGPTQPGGSTPKSRATGFIVWIALPIIIYLPFFIIALNER